MRSDEERTAVLAATRTAFEADTIAEALRARGIEARVMDAASVAVWGGAAGPLAQVKVVVLEGQLAEARSALSQIRFEGQSIDWDAVDVGSASDAPAESPMSRTRRWMWTLAVVFLTPAGLMVLAHGVSTVDPMVQIIGGTLLASAMVLAAYMLWPTLRGVSSADEDDDDQGTDAPG